MVATAAAAVLLALLLSGDSIRNAEAQTAPGTFAAAPVYDPRGLANVVFMGGTVDQLEAAALADGSNGAWAQDSTGAFQLLIVGGPAFLKDGFKAKFASGFGVTAITLTRAQTSITPPPVPTSPTTPKPAANANCRGVAAAASKPDCVYAGPLFDAHLHVGYPAGQASSGNDLLRMLNRDGIDWALGFYAFSPSPPGSSAQTTRIVTGARSRIVPLLQPNPTLSTYLEGFLASPSLEHVLGSYLRPRGAFAGIGEIPLYRTPSTLKLTFDSDQVQAILAAANLDHSIVMIHPRSHFYPAPTPLSEIERALIRYPNVTLVLHDEQEVSDLVEPLLGRYPNVYYTYDFPLWRGGRLTFSADSSAVRERSQSHWHRPVRGSIPAGNGAAHR